MVPVSAGLGAVKRLGPFGWFAVGVPVVLVLLALAWHFSSRRPPPKHHPLPPDTGMARVHASGVLRVAMDGSYPPFAVAAPDGSLHGLDVDLARAIAKQLGASLQLLNISEDGLPDALIAGQADVVISEQHPDPRLRLAYSAPYYNAGLVLLVAARDDQVAGFAALRGRTVGVELGSDADEWLRRQHLAAVQEQRYDSVAGAVAALAGGAIAGVVTDAPSAGGFLQQGAELRVAGPALTEEPYVVAAAPQNLSLIRAVNATLTMLRADGTLQALVQRDV
jgi:polar amino acid transport system substrate-binding protein